MKFTCTAEERRLLDALANQGTIESAIEAAKQGGVTAKVDNRGRPLPSLFVCTPSHDRKIHAAWTAGALAAQRVFSGRIAIDEQVGSILPRNRDLLTDRFLDSGATHMLCVDSDIGWHPAQAQALLDTGKPFVSGTYSKKQDDREIPAAYTGRRDGSTFNTLTPNPAKRGEPIEKPLWEATHVPAGFLLVERQVIERMIGAYRELEYRIAGVGTVWALWYPLFEQGVTYSGEDIAFCNRWRKIGGEIWMHRGVVLAHYGEAAYYPREDDVEPRVDRASRQPSVENIIGSMSDEDKRRILVAAGILREDGGLTDQYSGPVAEATSEENGHSTKVVMHGRLPVHVHQ